MRKPEQSDGPGLTRKQLREIRMTGTTPIIEQDAVDPPVIDSEKPVEAVLVAEPDHTYPEAPPLPPVPAAPLPAAVSESISSAPIAPEPAPQVHLPRAAEPAVVAPMPTPDAQVDLGVSPLTRRQAREQERIRTASVPVITADLLAAHAAHAATTTAQAEAVEPVPAAGDHFTVIEEQPASSVADDAEVVDAMLVEESLPTAEPAVDSEPIADESRGFHISGEAGVDASSADLPEEEAVEERPILRPEFGAGLLAGAGPSDLLTPSFDELIVRGASQTGSAAPSHALILSQTPAGPSLTAPVTATGEVLITGTFELPEGLGSRGHARGGHDGKDIDSVLIDGELPAASSPTPIAASAAISTVKGTGEIIRPPAPEKGNKFMLTLAITAGVLAVALVGVLILAFVTGVFS